MKCFWCQKVIEKPTKKDDETGTCKECRETIGPARRPVPKRRVSR